jgi:uncharacterized membrane protein
MMLQPKHENTHNRKQFQIDRVAFFSDAVIAIAITLMVLEIKIPPLHDITLQELVRKYTGTFILHSAALLICFANIGNLWIKHHDLYEHVINYNHRLIKSNLYFLLTIVLLPVSIAFVFEEDSPMRLKLFAYFINLSLCNLTYYFMLRVIFHQKNNFSALTEKEFITKNKQSTLFAAFIFVFAAVLGLMDVSWFYAPFFLLPALRIWRRVKKPANKNKEQEIAGPGVKL